MQSESKKIETLLSLISFLQNRGEVTREELLDRFDLNERTLQRYLRELEKGIGLRRKASGSDRRKVIYYIAPEARPGWNLTDLQYLALQIGRELVAKISDSLSKALQELLHRSQKRKLKDRIVQVYEPGLSRTQKMGRASDVHRQSN